MHLQPISVIKISPTGEHMPIDASGHAAVLYPDFGVMFAVGAEGFAKPANYDDTVKRAEDLTHAGETGWILAPDVRLQLLTIDFDRYGPAADPNLFPDAISNWHWTSHGVAWTKDDAGVPRAFWQVNGSLGNVGHDGRDGKAFSRPCRFVARPGQ